MRRPIGRRTVVTGTLAGLAGFGLHRALTGSWFSDTAPPALAGPSAFSQLPGFPLALPGAGIVELSSPVLYDIDGDGALEVIVGTTRQSRATGTTTYPNQARIVIVRPNGTIVQSVQTKGGGPIQGSISVGRLFGPSSPPFLVVPVGADVNDYQFPGGIQIFQFANGQLTFFAEFLTRDYFPDGLTDGFTDPVVSTPCLADFDGDGNLEIAFGTWDDGIYLVKPQPNGTVQQVWRYENRDTVWSSPSAADVNGDGFPEIIIGSDIFGPNLVLDPPITGAGGYVTCLNRFGHVLWSVGDQQTADPYDPLDQAIYSSPAIADIDGDGQLEVVVGTSDFYTAPGGGIRGNYVLCLNGATGAEKWRFITNGFGWASPAIGNVLGKKNPTTGKPTFQIAIPTERKENSLINESRIYLIDSDGTQVWAGKPFAPGSNGPATYGMKSSPILVDYDGDGTIEVLQPHNWDIVVFRNGQQIDRIPGLWSQFSSPAVADVDGDGKLELFVASSNIASPTGGWLNGWRLDAPATAARPWPMFRRSPDRTGALHSATDKLNTTFNVTTGQGSEAFTVYGSSDTPNTGYNVIGIDRGTAPLGSQQFTPPTTPGEPGWLSISQTGPTMPLSSGPIASISVNPFTVSQDGMYLGTVRITSTLDGATITPSELTILMIAARNHVRILTVPKRVP